jgi:hypothetical protein
VLKLTRESVVKAVGHGMAPSEIVARLKRLSSNAVPANVLKEVQGWCDWVRRVTAETLKVIRCPDRETADRILGVLKSRAERVNDTMVAVEPTALTPAERNRLRDQGVILESGSDVGARPKVKAKTRRRRW